MKINGLKIVRCASGAFHVDTLEMQEMINYNLMRLDERKNYERGEILPVKTVKRFTLMRAVVTKQDPLFNNIESIYNERMQQGVSE